MELKRYNFDFQVLDDLGHAVRKRLADNDDVEKTLEGEGPHSPSEHIWRLVELEQDKWPQLDQKSAVERVRKRNPALFKLYASESEGCIRLAR